jgi:hypothetical protein
VVDVGVVVVSAARAIGEGPDMSVVVGVVAKDVPAAGAGHARGGRHMVDADAICVKSNNASGLNMAAGLGRNPAPRPAVGKGGGGGGDGPNKEGSKELMN